MRLKKIIIFGFKSFADKIVLEFNHGITGIVGPNGCGKSNIADAFRWVLGEQSAKSMRGHKMNDVIFAGTTNRKPLNFAEVTIVLDSINGALPIDYEEVAITRRLHRSGESDYFLNKQPVRLKDVQSLLFDSGIGKNAFAIFEQGKIDQVINFSPLERRYIFEEAAGIVRFLQRKREALKKLEQVDLNINRVKDIHQEIEKQILVLEEQAEKARIYKEKKSQLGSLEKAVLVAKWDQLEKKGTEAVKQNEEYQKQLTEHQRQLVLLEKQLADTKIKLAQSEKNLQTQMEGVFKARSNKEIKTRAHQSNQERLKEILTQEKKVQQEIAALKDSHKERQKQRQEVEKQSKEIEKEFPQTEKALQGQREKVQHLETEVAKLREQVKNIQQERIKLLQSESQIEIELKQTKVRLDHSQERIGLLEEKQKKLAALLKDLSHQAIEKQKLMREGSNSIDDQKKVMLSHEKQIQEKTQQLQLIQGEINILHQEITEAKARQKVLLRLQEEMEGFSVSSKKLLQESADSKSPLYKKLQGLHEHIEATEGREKALAIALRPYMHTLVVKTYADLELVIEFAKKKSLKDFSLICLENLKAAQHDFEEKKGISSLFNHVTESRLAKHFLKEMYLTHDLETAFKTASKNPGVEMVTEEGVLIDKHGVIFFATQSEHNLFAREAELKILEKKLKEIEAKKGKTELAAKVLADKKTQLVDEHSEFDKAIRRSEMKLVESNFSLQRVNGDLEKTKQEDKQIATDLKDLLESTKKFNSSINQLTQKHNDAKEEATKAQKQSTSFDKDLITLVEKLSHQQHDFKDKESAYQKVAEEKQKVQHAMHLLDVKEQDSQAQEKRLEEALKEGVESQKKIQKESSTYSQDLTEVEKALNEASDSCKDLENEVQKQKTAIEQTEKKSGEMRDKIHKLESSQYQIGVQSAQWDSSRQTIEADLLERYHLSIADARRLHSPLEKTLEQAERQVRTLRQEVEATGDINMTSIEECDKHKVRHNFLNQQMGDLDVSKQELVQIITELDNESRKIFKDTFETICRNFKKNFKILFNGGEANLQFTETEDVLEAGIEIIAQPPGKQMRSINLLSGGEKCMTALALLFAIFEVKPAPFCILDEIDAPLDDSNVKRFSNIVKQFVDKCQFIMITHNKCTMSIADVLFGISMEEKGVSKILAMELAQTAPQPELV